MALLLRGVPPPRCFPWGVCFFLFDLLYPMAQIPTGADDMAPSGHREHAQTVSPQNSEYGARYRPRADPSPSAWTGRGGHRGRGRAGGRGGGPMQIGQQTPAHPGWQRPQADQH